MTNHPNRSKFHQVFPDGYTLTNKKATELAQEWNAYRRKAKRQGLRAQINYHGAGLFTFSSHPTASLLQSPEISYVASINGK